MTIINYPRVVDYYTSYCFLISTTNDFIPVRNDMSPSPHPTSRKTIHWIVLLGRVTRGEGVKFRRFRNMSWIIGRSAGSTQPSRGRVSLSLHSYQNPQFGMTINKISPSPYPSPTRGEGIKPPPRNQRFRSSRKGWTFCAFSLLFTPSAIRHAVSHGSFFAGSTSVPSPPPT